jgi:hypothetical protein
MTQPRTKPLIVLPGKRAVMLGMSDGSAAALTPEAAIATATQLQKAAYIILGAAALESVPHCRR